ncbi:MAG: hypothetical protein NC921_04050 [Candidatus Omnitrophica bacterium]|nr:hypothetical protein [Candidatus Omnitrophota bacterium]
MIIVSQDLRDFIFNKLNIVLKNKDSILMLEDCISEHMVVDEEIIDINDKYNFRVSYLVSCPRKEFFKNKGEEPVIDAQSFITLSFGNALHKILQGTFNYLGMLYDREELLMYEGEKYNIIGHYDGIIEWEGQKSFIEIKTLSPFAFTKVLKELPIVEQNYENLNRTMLIYRYLQQASSYIFLYQHSKNINLENNVHWLILVNKANVKGVPPLFTIKFSYDKNLVINLFNNADLIYDHLKSDILPPQTDLVWECKYCGYLNCPVKKEVL